MSLSPAFLDQLRERISLSALIGRTLKLEKAGKEHKACCPIHGEKTPSFTVNDDKGFYHCFGCGAHGDAIRWLTDQGGMTFMDAVRSLAEDAGMDVPAPSPEWQRKERAVAAVTDVLGSSVQWFGTQLRNSRMAQDLLSVRGLSPETIARFALGYAPGKPSIASGPASIDQLRAADLIVEGRDGFRDRFWKRIMIPIHDARGRVVGFGARAVEDGQDPKYLNSADSESFDKGRMLFNLHRAAPAARTARRMIMVEGYFDVIALDQAGISEAVAPMGTAMTEAQLERAWRVVNDVVLLLDGDNAGRKAALRACHRAMPYLDGGHRLSVAMLPRGADPDDMLRQGDDEGGGRAGIDAVLAAAEPISDFLWRAHRAMAQVGTPEGRSALWAQLFDLARAVRDEETRAQYLADWRRRFDAEFPPPPPGLTENDMLPDGRVASVSELGEAERERLLRVAGLWLERSVQRIDLTAKAVGRWAWDVGRRVAAGLIDDQAARDAIDAVRAGLTEKLGDAADPDKIGTDIDAAFAAGGRKAFDIDRMLLDMACAQFQLTDLGNAERFNARFGLDFVYTTAKGWMGYDGRRYRVLNQEKDSTPAEVLAAVMETVRAIQFEGGFVADTGMRIEDLPPEKPEVWRDHDGQPHAMDRMVKGGKKVEPLSAKLKAWGRTSEGNGKINCIANLAKRWLTRELAEFDTNPMLLNCLNGTLHFHRRRGGGSSVELRPHNRGDLLTKLTACDYDETAQAPDFEKLVAWAQPKPERRRYLQQWGGYNLTGDMGEQIFHIWWGPTAANGKSTVGNAMREAIGDYGDIINVETFLDEGGKKRGDAATPDLVRLPGVRFLTSGEVPKGAKINEALINTVTGGDGMNVRDNFRSFFRFHPIFKWTLWCNAKPDIPQGTEGIWRRIKVLLWESHLEPHERDRQLPDRLKLEYPGILAWMVRGLIDWMDNGFCEPQDVADQSAAYRDDSDPLASFLRLCTVEDPKGRIQSSRLYDVFCAWAKAAQEREWTQKGFSQAMKDRGFTNKPSNGMQWLGLRLVREVSDFLDEHGRVRAEAADLQPIGGAGDMGSGGSATPPMPPPDLDDDYPVP